LLAIKVFFLGSVIISLALSLSLKRPLSGRCRRGKTHIPKKEKTVGRCRTGKRIIKTIKNFRRFYNILTDPERYQRILWH